MEEKTLVIMEQDVSLQDVSKMVMHLITELWTRKPNEAKAIMGQFGIRYKEVEED